MKNFFLVLLLLVLKVNANAQTKNHHIVGLNIEYSTMPKIIGARLGTNFTYLYAYKHFCAKLELGALPRSNFGTMIKTCLNVGFTTNMNQPISIHAVAGIGGLTTTNTYLYKGYNYDAEIGNVTADVGILVRPSKNERLFVGMDLMFSAYDVYPTDEMEIHLFEGSSYRGLLLFCNFSINYKLNKARNPKKANDPLPIEN
jgi:hypothetical protein